MKVTDAGRGVQLRTSSDVHVAEGDHTIKVKKLGYKDWERTLKVSAGSSVHLNAELEKAAAEPNPQ